MSERQGWEAELDRPEGWELEQADVEGWRDELEGVQRPPRGRVQHSQSLGDAIDEQLDRIE